MFLRTFGGLVLEAAAFTRPKPLLLLCYLALEGAQDRRFLAELFWPDAGDRMKSLTVALTRIRSSIPGAIEADAERARSRLETDAGQFLTLLEQSKSAEALELYRGPFLDGFYLRSWGVELEEWVYQTREYLADCARRAMIELAERDAAQSRFEEAAKRAEAAYLLASAPDPDPDDLRRLQTLLYAGQSLQAANARREAERFGIDAPRSGQEARMQLQQLSNTRIERLVHDLPLRNTSFVGRDLELAEVGMLLSDANCRLLTLLGPPGVGKTRLGAQVAHDQLRSGAFVDGVHIVPLESISDARLLPQAVAEALEVNASHSGAPLDPLVEYIGDKHMLLVLDNFEHLVAEATALSFLLERCPRLKLLVTSRERLNVDEEHVFQVGELPFPQSEDLTPGEALHFESVQLFVQRAKRARPDFELTPETLSGVVRICKMVDGLPLGLELAAAWIHIMPPREIAVEIDKSFDFLETRVRNVPERHQSLRSAFEQSWRLLGRREQAVLRRLSVFKGGFRRAAAGEVSGATIPILASLVDKSLLHVTASGRYDRHPLVFQYTREKVSQRPEEQSTASAKHAAYFLKLAQELRPALLRPKHGNEIGALTTLAEEHQNLQEALRWSLEHDLALALKLAGALRSYWEIRGHLEEACEWLEAALAQPAEHVPDRIRFPAITTCGWFFFLRDQRGRAHELFAEALELSQLTGRPRDKAEALNLLGLLALEEGDLEEAESLCQQSLSLHRAAGNERGVAVTLSNLGNIARCRKDYGKAAAFYEESLALHRRLEIRRSQAIALANLGFLALHTSDIERSAKNFAESLAVRRELGDLTGLAHGLLGVAVLLCRLEDYQQSAVFLGAADELLRTTSARLARADQLEYEDIAARVRAQLTEERFEENSSRGRRTSTDHLLSHALELVEALSGGVELAPPDARGLPR